MRQRLFKIILCVILMVSVFLSHSFVARADTADVGIVFATPFFQELDSFQYSPNYHAHTYLYRVILPFHFNDNSVRPYVEGRFTSTFSFNFNVRKIANSSVSYTYALDIADFGILGIDSQYYNLSFSRRPLHFQRVFSTESVGTYPISISSDMVINFFDFPVSTRSLSADYWFVYVDFYVHAGDASRNYYSFSLSDLSFSGVSQNVFSSSDRLYSDSAPIVSSIDSNAQKQMEQQQQIADQQAEQSKKQHDELVGGYDSSSNDAMLSDKNQQLLDYEAKQDAAFDSANAGVMDFQQHYDTSVFVNLAPSFALISIWFNSLWGGMGSYSVVLVISLALCVAGYILKIKH